jgi:hypothetical protein
METAGKSPDRFTNDREALDFVSSRIVDQAQREGVSLSEVERKMLYFSETAWTLPDIWEVNDEFDKNYDQNEYEKKISQLIKKAVARARKQEQEEFVAWNDAIRLLSKEDRYLLIMTAQAGLRQTFRRPRVPRPPGDLWKLWGTGFAIVGLFLAFCWITLKFHLDSGKGSSSSGDFLSFVLWSFLLLAATVYILLQLLFGPRKVNRVTDRVLGWFFGQSKRHN